MTGKGCPRRAGTSADCQKRSRTSVDRQPRILDRPHLHLEIWDRDGTKIDPATWFRRRGIDV